MPAAAPSAPETSPSPAAPSSSSTASTSSSPLASGSASSDPTASASRRCCRPSPASCPSSVAASNARRRRPPWLPAPAASLLTEAVAEFLARRTGVTDANTELDAATVRPRRRSDRRRRPLRHRPRPLARPRRAPTSRRVSARCGPTSGSPAGSLTQPTTSLSGGEAARSGVGCAAAGPVRPSRS